MNNQNYINHVTFCIDSSQSMDHLNKQTIKVVDSQISYLAKRSQELDQETRASIYTFNHEPKCIIYDKDVLRLPSIEKEYKVGGNTALVDAAILALDDLAQTPQKYGDHSFLIYVITDGEENSSKNKASELSKRISALPDNWTLAVFVPNQTGVHEAKKFGFPANNISVWETTQKGMEEAGATICAATENYFVGRTKGVRGTKNLFDLNAAGLNKVKSVLTALDPNQYNLYPVHKDGTPIKEFVESWSQKPYLVGSSYYELNKPELIQAYKQVCIQDKVNGKVYSGPEARITIGLPNHEVKVSPISHAKYKIFVSSTSNNRKLVAGTQLLVLN